MCHNPRYSGEIAGAKEAATLTGKAKITFLRTTHELKGSFRPLALAESLFEMVAGKEPGLKKLEDGERWGLIDTVVLE